MGGKGRYRVLATKGGGDLPLTSVPRSSTRRNRRRSNHQAGPQQDECAGDGGSERKGSHEWTIHGQIHNGPGGRRYQRQLLDEVLFRQSSFSFLAPSPPRRRFNCPIQRVVDGVTRSVLGTNQLSLEASNGWHCRVAHLRHFPHGILRLVKGTSSAQAIDHHDFCCTGFAQALQGLAERSAKEINGSQTIRGGGFAGVLVIAGPRRPQHRPCSIARLSSELAGLRIHLPFVGEGRGAAESRYGRRRQLGRRL